jgi:hypothetical protein
MFFRHEWRRYDGGPQSKAKPSQVKKCREPRCDTDTWGTHFALLSNPRGR